MKVIKGFYSALDKIYRVVAAIGFGVIVTVLGVQIVLRLFGVPFMWAEEVCRYLYIMLVFMGSARAFSRGGHLTVDVLYVKFPKKMQLGLLFFYYICVLAFTVYFFYSGIQLVKFQWDLPMYTVSWFKLGWVDLCIPIGCFLCFVYVLRELYYMIQRGVGYFDQRGGVM